MTRAERKAVDLLDASDTGWRRGMDDVRSNAGLSDRKLFYTRRRQDLDREISNLLTSAVSSEVGSSQVSEDYLMHGRRDWRRLATTYYSPDYRPGNLPSGMKLTKNQTALAQLNRQQRELERRGRWVDAHDLKLQAAKLRESLDADDETE